MAKTGGKGKGKGKAKQQRLPTMEDKVDKDLTRLVEAYVEARDERMALTKKEVDSKNLLALKMREKNLTTYRDDHFVVTIDSVEKLKVRKDGDDEEAVDDVV